MNSNRMPEMSGEAKQPRPSDGIAAALERFPFFIQHREEIKKTSYHVQPGIEIDITHTGRGTFKVGHANEMQIPRQVVIFPGETPHQFVADASKPYCRTVVCIEPTHLPYVKDVLSKLIGTERLSWRLEPQLYTEADELCTTLDRELKEKAPDWESSAIGILLQVLVLIRRSAAHEVQSDIAATMARGDFDLTQACRDFIRTNIDRHVTLTSLAETFSISRGHLARQFRQEIGMTVHEYILSERLAEAKRLIITRRDLSITDIALSVGFQSLSHFSRTFHHHVGLSPLSYRKSVGHA